jgi:exosome complex component RRP46
MSTPLTLPSTAVNSSLADSSNPSLRADNRSNTQLRPIEAEYGLLNRADGSVRYLQGSTELLVGIYGPIAATSAREEKYDKAVVAVQFKGNCGGVSNSDISYSYYIKQIVENIILTQLNPRTKINIVIQIIRDDGGLLATAINATCLALLDAGIQLNSMFSAIHIQLIPNAKNERNYDYQLDPTKAEENSNPQSLVLAYNSVDNNLLTSVSSGPVSSAEVYFSALSVASKACLHIQHFYRQSLTQKAIKQE